MPGTELGGGRWGRWHSRRRVFMLLLAAVLAAVTAFLAAGAVMADGWPSSPPSTQQQ
jgi:hypothetical protein